MDMWSFIIVSCSLLFYATGQDMDYGSESSPSFSSYNDSYFINTSMSMVPKSWDEYFSDDEDGFNDDDSSEDDGSGDGGDSEEEDFRCFSCVAENLDDPFYHPCSLEQDPEEHDLDVCSDDQDRCAILTWLENSIPYNMTRACISASGCPNDDYECRDFMTSDGNAAEMCLTCCDTEACNKDSLNAAVHVVQKLVFIFISVAVVVSVSVY